MLGLSTALLFVDEADESRGLENEADDITHQEGYGKCVCMCGVGEEVDGQNDYVQKKEPHHGGEE